MPTTAKATPAKTYSVTGRVIDERTDAAKPVSNMWVEAWDSGGPSNQEKRLAVSEALTDNDGRFLVTFTWTIADQKRDATPDIFFIVRGGQKDDPPDTEVFGHTRESVLWNRDALSKRVALSVNRRSAAQPHSMTASEYDFPPDVDITSPAGNDYLAGTVAIQGTVTRTYPVDWELCIDNTQVASGSSADPVAYTWPTTPNDDGQHTIELRAGDKLGSDSDTKTVTVDNTAPVAQIMSPSSDGQCIRTPFALQGMITDKNIDYWDLSIGTPAAIGAPAARDSGSIVYYDWNTASDGSYNVKLTAKDKAGNTAQDVNRSVIVDNTPPAITVTQPNPGDKIKGDIQISVTIQDANLQSWQIRLDSDPNPIAQDSGNLGSQAVVKNISQKAAAGPHTVTVSAVDGAGNQTDLPPIDVTVESSLGEIKGRLFYDKNADGVRQQSGEDTLEGVVVTLSRAVNGVPQRMAGDRTSHTDRQGQFLFSDVPPGDWAVNLPAPINVGNGVNMGGRPLTFGLRLSDALVQTTLVSKLAAGDSIDLQDFGCEAAFAAVKGTVFLDRDRSGKPVNNPPLRGVKVTLHNLDTRSSRDDITDAQGRYSFDDPEAGKSYLVFQTKLDAKSVGLGEGTLDLETAGVNQSAFFVGPGRSAPEVDAAYVLEGGEVSGVVFLDVDADGRRFGHEAGLGGISVELLDSHNNPVGGSPVTTDRGGYYSFPGTGGHFRRLVPGKYTLRFTDSQSVAGSDYMLTSDPIQEIEVKAGQMTEAKPTGYQTEQHTVEGDAKYDDGSAVVGLIVKLYDATGQAELDTAVTDEQGHYVFPDRKGDFKVRFPDTPTQGQLLSPKVMEVHPRSKAVANPLYRRDGEGTATIVTPLGFGGGGAQDSLGDIASYMPTAQEVMGPTARSPVGGAPTSPGNLAQMVAGAMQDVLGRKLKTDDPTAFVASLNQAFVPDQILNGNTLYKWMPRTYAVQTELGGGLSGAQASFYHRANIAMGDALPLIDGLYPLRPDFDQAECDAVRAIVRTEFKELVDELGIEGGPRLQRVDDLFRLLDQELKRLQNQFGLTSNFVITVDQEQDQTNFLVIRDYVDSLRLAWNGPSGNNGFRSQFAGTGPRFLGTQLVLLSRALSVVAETVEEVNTVMDSVYLGPAERQTVSIIFPKVVKTDKGTVPILPDGSQPAPLLVDELLTWVTRFAVEEAPSLVNEGGRRGVETIQPVAHQLYLYTLGAAQTTLVSHIGFSRQRVRRALSELAGQLSQADQLAAGLITSPVTV